jgi:hypothetical protein
VRRVVVALVLALLALPAAAAVAVLAAVVHGLGSSGSPTASVTVQHAVAGRAVAPQPLKSYSATDQAHAKLAPLPSSPRLQHTDASLEIRVADDGKLSQATGAAVRIATSLGGYAQSVHYRTPQGGSGSATLDLRVPAENVKRALARLSQLGTVVSQQLSVTDLERRFQTESAQIAQLRRRVAALEQALRDPSLPDAQRVLLRIKLAESKRALSERLHARKGTASAAANAHIALVLVTREAIVTPPHHRGRLGRIVHSAVGFLALEAVLALYVVIVAAPLAAVVALAWWLARLRRRREEERLLAT